MTAARASQPIADVLADVTVIGADEILRSGVQSLAELLQRQPGVEIVQNGGPGSVSGALLRGANRGQTLVLIDGLRAGSSSSGSTTLEAIPLDQIERIEILRGPASSLYGADAIGGVVQVFTKRQGTGFTPNVSAGYGTYDTGALSAGFAGTTGPLRYSLQAGAAPATASTRSSTRTTSATTPTATAFRRRTSRPTLSWTWDAGQELAFAVFRQPPEQRSSTAAFPYFRRSHDHDGAGVERGEPQSHQRCLDVATHRGRRQRRLGFTDELRQFALQDDAAPILLAERLGAAAGRARRDSRAARGAPVDRRRLCDHAAQHQFRDRHLPAPLRGLRAAGQSAPRRFEPVRRQDDRRPGARLQAVSLRGA